MTFSCVSGGTGVASGCGAKAGAFRGRKIGAQYFKVLRRRSFYILILSKERESERERERERERKREREKEREREISVTTICCTITYFCVYVCQILIDVLFRWISYTELSLLGKKYMLC